MVDQIFHLVEETAGYISVCVRISGGVLARPVAVTVMTQDGSAVADDDFMGLSMVDIIFQPSGPTVECANISIVRDRLVENDELFRFVISPDQADEAVQVGIPSFANVIILDEEDGKNIVRYSMLSPVTFSSLYPVLTAVVDQTNYQVEETAGYVTVCVNISGGALARPVAVTVMTQDGSAIGRYL